MYKLGLKLWSTNKHYIPDAIKLYDQGLYHYIELFTVPNSFKEYAPLWKQLNIPYVIHGPHSFTGLNWAKKEQCKANIKLAQQAFEYADLLHSDTIIFHPGIDGNIQETIRQINTLNDKRILIENKPYYTIYDNKICNGHSPEEIAKVINQTDCNFCLDLGHAIYAANAQNIDGISYIKKFIKLSPRMYHLTDGNYHGTYDEHEHLGKGSFDFKKILSMVPGKSMISIETKKNYNDSLRDFEQDILTLKKLSFSD